MNKLIPERLQIRGINYVATALDILLILLCSYFYIIVWNWRSFRATNPAEDTQRRTFTNWCNKHLEEVNETVEDLDTDFSDGLKLIALVEALAKKKIPGKKMKPRNRIHQLNNVSMALQFLESEGVSLIAVGKTDTSFHSFSWRFSNRGPDKK